MPSYGQTVTLTYVAWDTSANAPKTGDSANHSLRWIKDGTVDATTPTGAEVSSTNAPGVYKATMTGTQAQCQFGTLCGKSSTANIVILPASVSFENLPTASPAASGGLPTVGTGTGQISLASGGVDVQTIKTQAVTCAAGVTVGAYVGNANALQATDANGRVQIQVGTSTGQLSITTGVVSANATQFGGQTVTASGAITAGAFIGNASAALQVDGSGYVKVSSGTGTGQISLTSGGVDVQTIKTQTITCAAGVTVGAFVGNANALQATDVSGRVQVQVGTSAGQLDVASGAIAVKGTVTLAAATHAGAVIPTVSTVTNAVTVGTNNDKSNYVLAATTHTGATIPTVTGITNNVNISPTQVLPTPRDLTSVADGSLTLGDALWSAISAGAGKWDVSGTNMTYKTPSTGTLLRTFTLDSGTTPTYRH